MTEQATRQVLPKPVVLYDGSCSLCTTTTDQLREMDKDGVIDWLDLHNETNRKRFPNLDWNRVEEEIHLIHTTGRVRTGSKAVADIAEMIGGDIGRQAAEMMRQPGIRDAADMIYKLVSQNRGTISAAMDKAKTAKPGAGSEA